MVFKFIQSGFNRKLPLAGIALLAIGLMGGCSGTSGEEAEDTPGSFSSSSQSSKSKIQKWTEEVTEASLKAEELRSALVSRLTSGAESLSSLPALKQVRKDLVQLDGFYASLQSKLSKATLAELSLDVSNHRLEIETRDMLEALSQSRDGILKALQGLDALIAAKEPAVQAPHVARSSGSPIVSAGQGGTITGLVRDSVRGTPISGAEVGFREATERDYFHRTRTNNEGAYQSPHLRPGEYAVDVIQRGYVTSERSQVRVTAGKVENENVSLTPPVAEGQFRITMSWTSAAPDAVSDVDSYLQIPGFPQPISYRIKGQEYGGAHLDRDDTDWVGPETTTIRSIKAGTYRYYVNNFNLRRNERALGNSMVSIQVYKGSQLVKTYRVPPGVGNTFEVFEIRDGEVRDVLRYNDQLVVH